MFVLFALCRFLNAMQHNIWWTMQVLHCMCMFSMQHDTLVNMYPVHVGGVLLDLWWEWTPTLITQHTTSEQLLTLKTYLMDTVSDHFNDYASLSRALEANMYGSQFVCLSVRHSATLISWRMQQTKWADTCNIGTTRQYLKANILIYGFVL